MTSRGPAGMFTSFSALRYTRNSYSCTSSLQAGQPAQQFERPILKAHLKVAEVLQVIVDISLDAVPSQDRADSTCIAEHQDGRKTLQGGYDSTIPFIPEVQRAVIE